MKKNITINLFGALYAIDEDAYELLKRYEENMRCYFRRKEGGEEISADIEYRVAELLAELKIRGVEAVNIGHVEEIIRRIGNPEQMDAADDGTETDDGRADGNADEAAASAGTGTAAHRGAAELWRRLRGWMDHRRLYRDPKDRIVGGVMSGLCRYFGGDDPLPWRIALVLLFFVSFTTVAIVYLALWALVPQARTAEDRLRMRGRRVNVETISDELVSDAREDKQEAFVRRETGGTGCFVSASRAVAFLFRGAVFLAGGMLLAGLLSLLAVVGYATIFHIKDFGPWSTPLHECQMLLQDIPAGYFLLWTFVVALFVAVLITVFGVGRRLMDRGRAPLSSSKRVTLWLTWLIAVAMVFASGFLLAEMGERARQKRFLEENTRDGIFLDSRTWDALGAEGWRLVSAEHCRQRVATTEWDDESGEEYTVYQFWPQNSLKPVRATIERSDDVPAGVYRLEALMCGARRGAGVYLSGTGDGADRTARVVSGQEGWEAARRADMPLLHRWPMKHDGEPNEAYDYVVIDSIRHDGGPLTYGVSNDIALTGRNWYGRDFCLLGITLQRVADLPAARPAAVAPIRAPRR